MRAGCGTLTKRFNDMTMRKFLLFMAFVCLPFCLFAQTTDNKFYIYNVVIVKHYSNYPYFDIQLDNGESIGKVRDQEGKSVSFRTPAAMLTYFLNDGWELFSKETANWGDYKEGNGSITPTSYIVLRKECSKEEVEEAYQRGIKRKRH